MAEQTPQVESPQSNQSISQIIVKAEFDARSLSEFVFKPYDYMVQRRLAPPIHTLDWYIRRLQLTLDQVDRVIAEDINPDYIASTIFNSLEGKIIQGMLYPALSEKIDKIDINHDAILKETFDRVNAVAQESRDRAEALRLETSARVDALAQEAQKRAEAISAEALARSNALIEEAKSREEALASAIKERDIKIAEEARLRAEAIAKEALARHDEITTAVEEKSSELSNLFSGEIANLEETFTNSTTEINNDIEHYAEKLEAITVDYNANKATFIEKIETTATATESNATAISGLVAKTDASEAEILEFKKSYASEREALATEVSSIKTSLGGNTSNITSELKSLSDADSAMNERINLMTTKVGENSTAITSETKARSDAITAVVEQVDAISAKADGALAEILSEKEVRVSEDAALAKSIESISSQTKDSIASVVKDIETRTTEHSALATEVESLTVTVGNNTGAITTEAETRATEDGVLSKRIDSVSAVADDAAAAVVVETQARADENKALGERITSLNTSIGGNTTLITESVKSLTEEDKALGSRIDTMSTKVGENATLITSSVEALTEDDLALGKRIDTMSTRVGNAETAITDESKARSEQDLALSERVSTVSGKVNANEGAILEEARVRAEADKATATKLDGVYAQIHPDMAGDNTKTAGSSTKLVGVWTETSARIEADMALGTRVDNLTAKLEEDTATITQEQKVLVDRNQSLASEVKAMSTSFGESQGKILEEVKLVSKAEEATATKLESLTLEYGNNKVQLAKDLKALVDKDKSILEQFTAFGTKFENNEANVTKELKTLTDKDTAITKDVELMQSKVALNEAAILKESKTSADRDSAMSTKLDGVFAQVNPPMAGDRTGYAGNNTQLVGVWTEMSARIEDGIATGNRIDVLTAKIEDSNATIKREQEVMSTATSAVAKSVETLQTSVNGNTASIQTQQKTVDGLSAQYTVKLDVNGRVSGFGLASDDKSSEFAVRADRFYIASPSATGKGVIPFAVEDGTVYAKDLVVKTANIVGSLKVGHFPDNLLTLDKLVPADRNKINKASDDIANLEIGGRNLISLYANGIVESRYLNASGATVSSSAWFITDSIPVTPNGKYILSGYSNLSTSQCTVFYDVEGKYISSVAGSKRQTVTAPENATSVKISLLKVDKPRIKFEKGNKATDWSPAPEDVDAAINSVNAAVDDITSDGKVAPNEKRELLRIKDGIVSTHVELLKSVRTVPDATTPTTYTTAYSDVTTRLTNATKSPTVTTNITVADRKALTDALSVYFTERGKLNDLLVTKSKKYTEDQMELAKTYAETKASDAVKEITGDNKITPNEKRDLLRVKDEIVSTHVELLKSVKTVPEATTPTTYTSAYSNVTTRLTNAIASPTTITNITTTDRTNLTNALSVYFTERAKLNDLLVTKSKKYTEDQMELAKTYAETKASDAVKEITGDNKITPNEKRELLRVKDEIVSTHTELLKSVITVPNATTPTTYTSAYSNVTTRLTNATASPSTITNITTTDRANLTNALSTYFTERAKLNDTLVTKTKESITTASGVATGAQNLLNNWKKNKNATLTIDDNRIAVGLIGANEIAANAISAKHIGANQIDATKINATNLKVTAANVTGKLTAAQINATNLSSISSNLGAVTAGSINIGGKFIVDSNGNVTAKSGTFDGTVKIANAQVDTLQIAKNAVTVPRLVYLPDPSFSKFLLSHNTSAWAVDYFKLASVTINPLGGAVSVRTIIDYLSCSIEKTVQASAVVYVDLVIKVGGKVLETRQVVQYQGDLFTKARSATTNFIVLPEFLITTANYASTVYEIGFNVRYVGEFTLKVGSMSLAVTGVLR